MIDEPDNLLLSNEGPVAFQFRNHRAKEVRRSSGKKPFAHNFFRQSSSQWFTPMVTANLFNYLPLQIVECVARNKRSVDSNHIAIRNRFVTHFLNYLIPPCRPRC